MVKDLELGFVSAYVNGWDDFDNALNLATRRDKDAALNLLGSILDSLGNFIIHQDSMTE